MAPLADAARLDPNSGEAALLLGMASYHTGDVAGANAALERAERQLPDRAEVSLYRGLLLLEGDPAAAASRFESAAGRGGSLEPAATYYAAVARVDAGQREEAETLLRRVQELAPGSIWAQRADEALRTPATEYRLRRWAVLYAGIDYDSNVVLRGDDVSLPADVSNQGDGLGWWAIEAGHELFRRDGWGGGVLGNYYGNAHFSLSDFDQDLLGASLWVDRTLGEHSLLRIQPEFGQGFYDYDDYLRFYGVLVELLHDWGNPGQGTFYTRYDYNNYQYRIPGDPALASTRNRDGNSVRVGYDHHYTIDQDTAVRGGPFFRYYAAAGSEYDYLGVGVWAGVERKLPWELTLDVLGSVAYVPLRQPVDLRGPADERRPRGRDQPGAGGAVAPDLRAHHADRALPLPGQSFEYRCLRLRPTRGRRLCDHRVWRLTRGSNMSNRNRWIVGFACGTALAFSAAPALADDPDAVPVSGCTPVGHVASLSGSATAHLPGAAARSIACGDAICAGDSVTTGAASSAGLLVGDVLTQLDADSTARIGMTPESAVDVQLARGGVRMIDPSSGDAPARLSAVGAQGRVAGNDAEGYVLSRERRTIRDALRVGRAAPGFARPADCHGRPRGVRRRQAKRAALHGARACGAHCRADRTAAIPASRSLRSRISIRCRSWPRVRPAKVRRCRTSRCSRRRARATFRVSAAPEGRAWRNSRPSMTASRAATAAASSRCPETRSHARAELRRPARAPAVSAARSSRCWCAA